MRAHTIAVIAIHLRRDRAQSGAIASHTHTSAHYALMLGPVWYRAGERLWMSRFFGHSFTPFGAGTARTAHTHVNTWSRTCSHMRTRARAELPKPETPKLADYAAHPKATHTHLDGVDTLIVCVCIVGSDMRACVCGFVTRLHHRLSYMHACPIKMSE